MERKNSKFGRMFCFCFPALYFHDYMIKEREFQKLLSCCSLLNFYTYPGLGGFTFFVASLFFLLELFKAAFFRFSLIFFKIFNGGNGGVGGGFGGSGSSKTGPTNAGVLVVR